MITENGVSHSAYGYAGIIAGSFIFFAYVGFDAVSTQAGEAINPKKRCTICYYCFLLICTFLYILGSLV